LSGFNQKWGFRLGPIGVFYLSGSAR